MSNDTPATHAPHPARRNGPGRRANLLTFIALAALVAVIIAVVGRSRGGAFWGAFGLSGHGQVPSMFDPWVTLAQATDRASESGKVVLAFATASWCPPCKVFKREALSDPRVARWAKDHAETVYIDVDERSKEAESLGVGAIPAIVILREGKVAARSIGAVPADELLAWLDTSLTAHD